MTAPSRHGLPGGEAAVGSGGVLSGEDGPPSGVLNGVDDVGVVGGDEGLVDVGVSVGSPPSVDYHGGASDVGERFSGQAAGVHPRGDDGGDPHGVNV